MTLKLQIKTAYGVPRFYPRSMTMNYEDKYNALKQGVIDLFESKLKYNESKSIVDLEAYRQSLQRIQKFIDEDTP